MEVEPGIYSVLVGNRSYEVKIVPGGEGYYVDLDGHRSFVEVRDPRTLVRSGRGGLGEGRLSVAAPMPGKVIRVLVAAGAEVQAGDGLIVVEAMKMQNEMKAPKGGRVVEVAAREGATVVAGEVLAVIE
jgi:biotin carboxyl carrier protein